MDGDPTWGNRNTMFLAEDYAGDELEVEFTISDIKDVGGPSELYGTVN